MSEKKKLHIYKIGGNIIDQQERLERFLERFAALDTQRILVHGGGRSADRLLEKLGIRPAYQDGRRITDRKTLDVVTMTYGGLINRNIVAKLQKYGCNGLGMSGADGDTIRAVKRRAGSVDYGFAGDVTSVQTDVIIRLIEGGLVPVFCALTHDRQGQLLNTNADTIASELGVALSEHYRITLFYCFESPGVLEHIENPESYFRELNHETYQQGIRSGILSNGILPKLHNAFEALKKGVSEVRITSAEEIHKEQPRGTRIVWE